MLELMLALILVLIFAFTVLFVSRGALREEFLLSDRAGWTHGIIIGFTDFTDFSALSGFSGWENLGVDKDDRGATCATRLVPSSERNERVWVKDAMRRVARRDQI